MGHVVKTTEICSLRLRLERAHTFMSALLLAPNLCAAAKTQDINPVTYQLVTSQRCLVLFVGDHHQRLYRFSHAEDGLYRLQQEQPAGSTRALTLNHSFRLGPAVAEAANR